MSQDTIYILVYLSGVATPFVLLVYCLWLDKIDSYSKYYPPKKGE